MRIYLPWWLKISIKILISRLPLAYKFWKRIGLFEHGKMNNQSYAATVFFEHIKRSHLNLKDLQGKKILEMGPGDSIATVIIASCFKGKVILIDAGSFASEDIGIYVDLEKYLQNLGYNPMPISKCKNIKEILELCDAQLFSEGLDSFKKLPDCSIDLIFSQAVLEHVRKFEFQETMKETYRLLKNDGSISHQVDLKDHLGGGLNNLRFSEEIWESSLFTESGFYTNRMSYNEMLNSFLSEDFKVEVIETNRWKELPIKLNKLAKEFQKSSLEDRLVKGFSVVLTKSNINLN